MIDESSALNVFGGFFTKIARRTLLKNIVGVTLRYSLPHVCACVCVRVGLYVGRTLFAT